MMRKNHVLLIGLALLMTACVVTVAVVYLLPPKPGVAKENFDRIEVGMTRAEVEKLFGGKANGFHRLRPYNPSPDSWEDDETGEGAELEFDANDCVKAMQWFPNDWPDERTVWEKFLDRLPWRERPRRPRPEILYLMRNLN
jgi:hypothetical protein